MFCQNCGKKNPDDARFCTHCGKQLKRINKAVNEKNMIFALFLSFFLIGLGLCYTGNRKKGIIVFVLIILFIHLRHVSSIFYVIAMILWAYSVYETYKEVKKANGESNQSLIKDIGNLSSFEYLAPVVVMAILMLVYYFLVSVVLY